MVTTEWYRQGARRRACSWCDGHGRVTMGWPENVSWDANASPCSRCGARGWVADAIDELVVEYEDVAYAALGESAKEGVRAPPAGKRG